MSMKTVREACSKILDIARYLIRGPAMSKIKKPVSGDATAGSDARRLFVKVCLRLCPGSFLFARTVHCSCCGERAQGFCCYSSVFSKPAVESPKLAVERDLVFNKRTQQQSGQRGQCLWETEEEKSLVCDSLLVIVVKSVRGAFSGQISWHIWYFCLMSQHRFHNVKEQKKGKCVVFLGAKMQNLKLLNRTFKNKVQFCRGQKSETPLNVTSILFFLLAESRRVLLTCICKNSLAKIQTIWFFSLQIIFVVMLIADYFHFFQTMYFISRGLPCGFPPGSLQHYTAISRCKRKSLTSQENTQLRLAGWS